MCIYKKNIKQLNVRFNYRIIILNKIFSMTDDILSEIIPLFIITRRIFPNRLLLGKSELAIVSLLGMRV